MFANLCPREWLILSMSEYGLQNENLMSGQKLHSLTSLLAFLGESPHLLRLRRVPDAGGPSASLSFISDRSVSFVNLGHA